MIVQRTSQVWTAAATLYRRRLSLSDNNFLFIVVERCSRTLKIGAIFTLKHGNVELSSQRYFFPSSCSYFDCLNLILKTDYGYFRTLS